MLASSGKGFEPYQSYLDKEIVYRGKVKLHGQNGGVQVNADKIGVQSRSLFLKKDDKLAKVIYAHEAFFRDLFDPSVGKPVTVFGEFCGAGIQSGVALSQLKQVIFAVFSIEIDGSLIVEPDDITAFLTRKTKGQLPEGIHVIPWHGLSVGLTLPEEKSLEAKLEELNKIVNEIDREDPWVLANFNKKGPGEGLVLFPISLCDQNRRLSKTVFPDFAFKAKGEKHRTVETKSAVTSKPAGAPDAERFAAVVCTEARLKQGLEAVPLDKKNTGKFIKWVQTDVEKEAQAELAASNLTFSQVSGAVSKLASKWFMDKIAGKA